MAKQYSRTLHKEVSSGIGHCPWLSRRLVSCGGLSLDNVLSEPSLLGVTRYLDLGSGEESGTDVFPERDRACALEIK